MRLEITLIFLFVIGAVKGLNAIPADTPLGKYVLYPFAILLVAIPAFHARFRRVSLHFFEKTSKELLRSTKIFFFTSLALFPLFLVANHFYQGFFHRTFSWQWPDGFFSFVPIQLFLISLPEEFFFRGWLQPLIGRALGPHRAIFATALLFAAAHSFIQFAWWHFAIFFPGVVFGWLRQRTGAVTASVLFHAVSNLLVVVISSCYS